MLNICMIVYSYYPNDVRVRKEAEALAEKGYSIDIICLKNNGELKEQVINGVHVYRFDMKRQRKGKLTYLWQYFIFIIRSFLMVNLLDLRKKYSIVHIHNMPDILILSGIVQKMKGAKLVLDLHDPMPEVYMTKYSLSSDHIIIKTLKLFERVCVKLADIVLTPNIAFQNLFVSRGCPKDKIHIIMNSPQESIFFKDIQKNANCVIRQDLFDGKHFIIMFHGTIVERHGLDTAVEAMVHLKKHIPNVAFLVFGEGDFVDTFLKLREKHDLTEVIHYYGHVPIEEIVTVIPKIDVGLIPNKLSPFTDLNLPTRIFEYLCLGKPVIVPRTKGILDYFNEEDIYYFESDNPENLCSVILDVHSNEKKRQEIIMRGIRVYRRHTWDNERERLLKLVDNLV